MLARREPINRRKARLVSRPASSGAKGPSARRLSSRGASLDAPAPLTAAQLRARRLAAARAAKRRLRVVSLILVANATVAMLADLEFVAWHWCVVPVGVLVVWLVACRLMVKRELAEEPSARLPTEPDADQPVGLTGEVTAVVPGVRCRPSRATPTAGTRSRSLCPRTSTSRSPLAASHHRPRLDGCVDLGPQRFRQHARPRGRGRRAAQRLRMRQNGGAPPAPGIEALPRPLSILLLGGLVTALLTPVPTYAAHPDAPTPGADPARDRPRHARELHRRGVVGRRWRRAASSPSTAGRTRSRSRWTATAKVRNDAGAKVVLDGGGLVTLSGGGKRRILYQNTCDKRLGHHHVALPGPGPPASWSSRTSRSPTATPPGASEGGGGGAVFVRGGRLKVVNSPVLRNRCDTTGPDLGGAAMRVLDQFRDGPVYVVGSTFDRWHVLERRRAVAASASRGWSSTACCAATRRSAAAPTRPSPAPPAAAAAARSTSTATRSRCGSRGTVIEDNVANEGGGAVFFVSNDRTGTLSVEDSTLRGNPSLGFETTTRASSSSASGEPQVTGSTVDRLR